MSRRTPAPGVVWASALAAVPPLALLALLVAGVLPPPLEPVTTTAAATAIALWGARAGVLASGRRGAVWWRGLTQLGRLGGVVAVAFAVHVAALGPTPPASVAETLVPTALLLSVFHAARAIGDIHRRQADPLATVAAHRAADAALGVVLVLGALAVLAVTAMAWVVDALVPPAPGFPLVWLIATITVLIAARPAVLRARTGTVDSPAGLAWLGALLPIVGAVVVVVTLIALVLASGAGQRLQAAAPQLPALQLDLFADAAEAVPPPAAGTQDTRGAVRWQVALLVGVVVSLLMLGRVDRRRRRALRRVGPGMSLLMFLRSLLVSGRSGRAVDDDETELDDRSTDGGAVVLGRAPPSWVGRLRRRPRDPAAAILHDYRAVQRRLPAVRRRRPAETVLDHAAREDSPALRELADLVCAIRYAGRRPSAADADRSRHLTRTLQRDR